MTVNVPDLNTIDSLQPTKANLPIANRLQAKVDKKALNIPEQGNEGSS